MHGQNGTHFDRYFSSWKEFHSIPYSPSSPLIPKILPWDFPILKFFWYFSPNREKLPRLGNFSLSGGIISLYIDWTWDISYEGEGVILTTTFGVLSPGKLSPALWAGHLRQCSFEKYLHHDWRKLEISLFKNALEQYILPSFIGNIHYGWEKFSKKTFDVLESGI